MNSNEIREKFLNFFKGKYHTVVRSDLLVPANDPTLLFTGAGMNQFKEQFMGRNITYKRAVSCQKCIRTGDLENVGKTPRHHTFFEMLGNFSFGDYFKREAIQWSWEFMTKEMDIPAEKLWITVYEEDEESYKIWLNEIEIPAKKIIKLGPADNFWPADAPAKGPNGPCGPCSEIFYDWGSESGCGEDSCDLLCDCGRFVEVWNLVFTEFERKPDGKMCPLPNKNIDTGMGLERMVSVKQGVRTNFETDLFLDVKTHIAAELEGITLTEAEINLVADHIRAATFSIADGVSPSNGKRGYVVRKLIRRAALRGSAKKRPFLFNIVPVITGFFKDVYPELEEKREHIAAIVAEEERRFNDTLKSAMPLLEEMLSGDIKVLSGEMAFKLVDTFGMPFEIVQEIAGGRNVKVDIDKFESLMESRKEQSRKGSDMSNDFIFQPDQFADAPRPVFSGELPLNASLVFILKEDDVSEELVEGDKGEIIISPQSSNFYAESGGQVGDTGTITGENGRMDILNTFEADGKKVFGVYVKNGSFKRNDSIVVDIDAKSKAGTARNHTATHLLQAALRKVLGEHVKQAGSYVDGKRLRFDFSHMKKLSDRELAKIEDMVNTWIEESILVTKEVMSMKNARAEGALMFFGEKYGETVRVVGIADRSKELCGGTHVDNTSDIEVIKVISESSVASGLRRIEALTADNARNWLKEVLRGHMDEFEMLNKSSKVDIPEDVISYARGVIDGTIKIDGSVMRAFGEKINPEFLEAREHLKKISKKRQKEKESGLFEEAKKKLDEAVGHLEVLGKINFVSALLEGAEMPLLKKSAAYLSKKLSSGVILLGSADGDKAYLICLVTPDLADKGVNARNVIKAVSGNIAGGGGGTPAFAQAGGKNPAGLQKALNEARNVLQIQ